MKTELEKCLSGGRCGCHVPVLVGLRRKTYELLLKYNSLPYGYKEEKCTLLKEVFESVGKKVSVGHFFIYGYGRGISIDDNASIGTGCTFMDCNKVIIDNSVLITPNVQIYTTTHPVELNERLTPTETKGETIYIRHTYTLPVTIKDGCWIGGGIIILSGVTVGRESVIEAGSVITKSIPANGLAVGDPYEIIREIDASI